MGCLFAEDPDWLGIVYVDRKRLVTGVSCDWNAEDVKTVNGINGSDLQSGVKATTERRAG